MRSIGGVFFGGGGKRRCRALELIYVLVNAENVRPLVREMTNFLTVADHELRPDLTAKICAVAERYAPTAKWRVDTVLRVMALPGHHISERIQSSLIGLIAGTPELHAYAVGKLYLALANEPKQQVRVSTRARVSCSASRVSHLTRGSSFDRAGAGASGRVVPGRVRRSAGGRPGGREEARPHRRV